MKVKVKLPGGDIEVREVIVICEDVETGEVYTEDDIDWDNGLTWGEF